MNSNRKIVFFIESQFNARDQERYGIDILQKNGFRVEVWDFTPFLRPNVYNTGEVLKGIDWEGYKLFVSKKEALDNIARLEPDSIINCFIGYLPNSYSIYRMITKRKLKYCIFLANEFPRLTSINRVGYYLGRLSKATLSDVFKAVFCRIPALWLNVSPSNFILAGGNAAFNNGRYPLNKDTETIWMHSWDYDVYLREKDAPIKIKGNIGVFLDQFAPFHEDDKYRKPKFQITADEYYPALNSFFRFLEKTYDVDMVIAAHPRSNYEEHSEFFCGRKIIKGRTAELVKSSAFAVAHSTTSINYAVLFKKPIIFITTEKYHMVDGVNIDLLSNLLRKNVININRSLTLDWKNELIVNDDAYEKYASTYIKHKSSPELPFWQIFADRMKLLK